MSTEQQIPMSADINKSEVSSERQMIGKFLYRFAWAFEITAVTIGLAISLSILMSNFEEMQSYRKSGLTFADWTNIFIAAVPFFMVAMVEVTKIPLVGAFYKTSSKLWTWIFGFCLVFVVVITFESALNGFERNFSALMYSIDTPKKELVTLDQSIAKLDEDRVRLSNLTLKKIDAEYNERYEQLFTQSNTQKTRVQEQINLLRASIQTEYVESLRERLASERMDKDRLYRERAVELDRLSEEFGSISGNISDQVATERRSIQTRLLRAEQELATMEEQAQREIDAIFSWNKDNVKFAWEQKLEVQEQAVAKLRGELNSMDVSQRLQSASTEEQAAKSAVRAQFASGMAEIDSKIDQLTKEISKSIGTKEREIETNISGYQQQLRGLDDQFQSQLAVIQGKRDNDLQRYENNAKLIDGIDQQRDHLQNNKIAIIEKINEKVGTNQIYRIAAWWSNQENAAEIDRSLVALVALFWFGSLSALIAATGLFLALAAYVIEDPSFPDTAKRQAAINRFEFRKFYRALRRFMVYRSRKTRLQKEIVEVDRIVFKEVPVEVVKKEFVHVPFYTNDARLLNMSGKSIAETGEAKDDNQR